MTRIRYPLCHEKGRLIGQKREERDKSKSLLELEKLVQELFRDDELVMPFLNHIHQQKLRYYRDQLGLSGNCLKSGMRYRD